MPLMHCGTLVNRPTELIIISLGSFALLVFNRIPDIGNKGRLHLPPRGRSKTSKSNSEELFSLPLGSPEYDSSIRADDEKHLFGFVSLSRSKVCGCN